MEVCLLRSKEEGNTIQCFSSSFDYFFCFLLLGNLIQRIKLLSQECSQRQSVYLELQSLLILTFNLLIQPFICYVLPVDNFTFLSFLLFSLSLLLIYVLFPSLYFFLHTVFQTEKPKITDNVLLVKLLNNIEP